MPAALELAQDAFRSHLPLEVLDGALDALVANLDFEGLTLDGIGGVRQGTALLTCLVTRGKRLSGLSSGPGAQKDRVDAAE